MCLHSKTDKPCIAEEDIICYKMLDRYYGLFYQWQTPFRGMKVRNAVLNGRRLMKARGERKIIGVRLDDYSILYEINGGYIHTYKDFPTFGYDIGYNVFKCVIPKGEEYFESVNGSEYASRSIRFVKQVN